MEKVRNAAQDIAYIGGREEFGGGMCECGGGVESVEVKLTSIIIENSNSSNQSGESNSVPLHRESDVNEFWIF